MSKGQNNNELKNRKPQNNNNNNNNNNPQKTKEQKEVSNKQNNDKENNKGKINEQKGGITNFLHSLFEEEDASSLIVFRVLWGLIMAYEAYTYLIHDYEKIHSSFYSSSFNFKYYGFEWCILPQDPFYIYLLMWSLFFLGIFITIGFFYRTSALLFTIGFGYMYMLEQSMYLNHFYLVTILSFMMILLPCNCFFSVDCFIWPSIRRDTAPRWCYFFIKTELFIVYTYAGICKINEDWLRAQPLLQWLSGRSGTPIIGDFLIRESTAYFMSYGGLIYDLIVGFLLITRKFRVIGVACSVFFHCSNKLVFNIGIFPWMMLASTTFFFDPDWPRYLCFKIARRNYSPLKLILMPLRHWCYPGDVAWNEYGHQFSWRMKLRTKKCEMVAISYINEYHEANLIPVQQLLTRRQYRKVPSRPDMIIQFAHQLRDMIDAYVISERNSTNPYTEIYIDARCELNGRPFQAITDPSMDLAHEKMWQIPYPWVTELLPLPEELKIGYPWNWEWNFNWLKGIDSKSNWVEKISPTERYEKMRAEAIQGWRQMFAARDPQAKLYGLNNR